MARQRLDQQILDAQQTTDAILKTKEKMKRAKLQGDQECLRRLVGDLSYHLSHLDNLYHHKDMGLFQFDYRNSSPTPTPLPDKTHREG